MLLRRREVGIASHLADGTVGVEIDLPVVILVALGSGGEHGTEGREGGISTSGAGSATTLGTTGTVHEGTTDIVLWEAREGRADEVSDDTGAPRWWRPGSTSGGLRPGSTSSSRAWGRPAPTRDMPPPNGVSSG